MALVRCTCVLTWSTAPGTAARVEVQLLDPDCAYVVHRAAAGLVGRADLADPAAG